MTYKILAVDDNPINLKLLNRALVNSNYEIHSAASGKEALDLTSTIMPDLILLDVMMDEMDGYEVCRILQEQSETNQIPIIFLSAKNESVDKARGLALGAVDYLTKPFDPAELNTRVQTQLKIRKNNIRLLHENQILRDRIQAKDAQIESFLNSIKTDYAYKNDSFSCAAKVISNCPPQTSNFIPLLEDNEQFLFLILNGLKKDYATLAVELLLEQYITGFCGAQKKGAVNNDLIGDLVHKVMERFSPDIYGVTFSFAIGWLQKTPRKLSYFGIRQNPPFLMDAKGNPVSLLTEALTTSGSYTNLIDAIELAIPENTILCFYRNGMVETSLEEDAKLFSKSIKTSGFHPEKIVQDIQKELPETNFDQMVSILHVS